MKIGLQKWSLTLLLFLGGIGYGQSIPPGNKAASGIVVMTETVKTITYEIKVSGLTSLAQATGLDALMRSKQGIVSSTTRLDTRVCRVEVYKTITEANLRDVIQAAGLEVAKTFEDQ